jgi:hypothetical protein
MVNEPVVVAACVNAQAALIQIKARDRDRLQLAPGNASNDRSPMYENGAMLAVFLLIYSAVAGRIERSLISGPIVFTAAGFVLGTDCLGILRIHLDGEGLRLLAELTLAMVLFTDAANADVSVVRRNLGLPKRLLGVGLPLTIVIGFLVAAVVFPRLGILEMALLATILAPTDAALGKPVVVNPAVPAAMREALIWKAGSTTASVCLLSCCCWGWRLARKFRVGPSATLPVSLRRQSV